MRKAILALILITCLASTGCILRAIAGTMGENVSGNRHVEMPKHEHRFDESGRCTFQWEEWSGVWSRCEVTRAVSWTADGVAYRSADGRWLIEPHWRNGPPDGRWALIDVSKDANTIVSVGTLDEMKRLAGGK